MFINTDGEVDLVSRKYAKGGTTLNHSTNGVVVDSSGKKQTRV